MSATPSGFPFPLTGGAFIDVITTGYKWNLDYTRTINWAIADGFYGEYWKSPATVRHELQHAFDAFSYFANVTFSYTGYLDDPQLAALAGAQMTVSMDGAGLFMSGWNMWACGFFPTTDFDAYYGQPGDVFLNLNSDANYLPSYSPGTTGFALILHELGHALGLKHTHDDGGTGRPTIAQPARGMVNFGMELQAEIITLQIAHDSNRRVYAARQGEKPCGGRSIRSPCDIHTG